LAIAFSNKDRLPNSLAHGFTEQTQMFSSLSSKPRPKKGGKQLAENQQQTLLQAAKVLFTTKTTCYEKSSWLREIKEHERKSDTTEK